jgi:hypothetical protein
MPVYNLASVTAHLDRLLDARSYPKTICPSEVARALSAVELRESGADCDGTGGDWRLLMPEIRELAFRMRDEGNLEILQRGFIIPETRTREETTGPIRLRRRTRTETGRNIVGDDT